jgi:elongation factor P
MVGMLSPGELKRGQIIEIDGATCVIENIVVQTPTSRGSGTLWKVRARDLKLKRKVDKIYKGGDTIAVPNFEKRPAQFLYGDAAGLHFMDLQDYDQFVLKRESLEEEGKYLADNMEGINSLVLDEEVIGIELPPTVDLKIVKCDPALKGTSSSGRTKPATLESGLVLQVPEHIETGELVRVETSTGRFLQRAPKS